jgi:hypothetical protein
MAYATKFKTIKVSAPSGWDHEKALAEALAERSRFLEMYPQYREFQSDIDKMLDKSGSRSNRMVVLAMLIEGKLAEMGQEFKKLQGVLTQVI